MIDEPLLNQREVASLLGCSPRTLENWRWRKAGPRYIKLSGSRRGSGIRYRRGDVEAFLEERAVGTRPGEVPRNEKEDRP